jgi:ribosome-binding protein aMBF1 (putative translation factor)
MATLLAPVDAREVIRCDACTLVQFVPGAGIASPCRQCHVSLDVVPEPEPKPIVATVVPHEAPSLAAALSTNLRTARLRLGLSQRQLAARIHTPRTYVSKTENLEGHADARFA